jgi:spermidine synthase
MTTKRRVLSLYLFIFLSGVAGLGYEMVWTRMFGLALGHEILAVLAVVAAFFSGLALGAYNLDGPIKHSAHPGHWYALLELIIGIWSLLLILLLPEANRFAASLIGVEPSPIRQWLISFCFPFILLLPATAAMGGTLPAIERLVSRLQQDGWTVGGLYAANTFGAVVGTMGATFWLTPMLGFNKTLIIFALINFICAAGVLIVSARHEQRLPRSWVDATSLPSAKGLLVAVFTTGLLDIGYEVIIVRVIGQVLENTVYTFASILSIYLLGTAIGAALYQRYAPRHTFTEVLTWLLQATSIFCLLGVVLLWVSEPIYEAVRTNLGAGFIASIAGELVVAMAVFLPPTLAMGATFSHLAQAGRDASGLGIVLGINTLGAALAPLLFGVLILPLLGSKTTLILLSLGYLLLTPQVVSFRSVWKISIPAGAGLALLLMPAQLRFVTPPPGGELIEHKEGVMAAVSLVSDTRQALHLKVNDRFQMGGTTSAYSDRRQAFIPLLLHPQPKHALFLGIGAGITFATADDYPGLQADGVELVPEILPLLAYFERSPGEILDNPRLKLFVGDARRFVSASRKQYDVIVADLFHPARDGAGSLYTLEHFRAVRARLSEDGIFCQWLPLYQMDLETLRSIVRTYLEVFPDGSAYLAHFSLQSPMIGLVSQSPATGYPDDWLESRMQNDELARTLRGLRLHNIYALFGNYLAGSTELATFAGDAPINQDDYPYVIFQAPRFAYSQQEPAQTRLLELVDRFKPNTEEVLALETTQGIAESHQRLERYWQARNAFLHLGVGVPRTGDALQLFNRIGGPLLELVRISPDFDAAYNPLLGMARKLSTQDINATKAILLALADANPQRPEAGRLLERLSAAGLY